MKRILFLIAFLAFSATIAPAQADAQSNPPLTISDGTVQKTNPSRLVFPGGTLTIEGGTVTYTAGGGGAAWGSITGTLSNQTDLQNALNLKANLASPVFTGTVTIPTPFTLGAVSVLPTGTELNFVDGVTSNIQTQLDAKAPVASPVFTGTVATNGVFSTTITGSQTVAGVQLNSTTVGIGASTLADYINIFAKSGLFAQIGDTTIFGGAGGASQAAGTIEFRLGTTTTFSNASGTGFVTLNVGSNTTASMTLNSVGLTTKPALRIDQTTATTALPLDVRLNSSTVATITPTGGATFSDTIVQTSASATAFESGPNGATNPTFRLVNNTGSALSGVSITGGTGGSGAAVVSSIGSTANEALTVTAKGNQVLTLIAPTGAIRFQPNSSGNTNFRMDTDLFSMVSSVVIGISSSATVPQTPDVGFSRTAAGVIGVGTGAAGSVAGGIRLSSIIIGANLAFSATAPTISAGFGTSPTIAGSATSFTITIGTGGTADTGTVTLPTAATGWVCQFNDITNNASFVTSQTGGSTTTATVQNYSRTTGLAIAWTAADVLRCSCVAY